MEWGKFWIKVLNDFLNVRSFITLGGFGLLYVMIYRGKIEPAFLTHIIDILLGFWFGQKVAQAIAQQQNGGQQK